VIERGDVLETARSTSVGGCWWSMATGGSRGWTRQGQNLAREAGFDWKLGDKVPAGALDTVAAWMAEAVCTAILGDKRLYLTERLRQPVRAIGGVMFSGGVGEYVYGRESRDFGRPRAAPGRGAAQAAGPGFPASSCRRRVHPRHRLRRFRIHVQLSGNTYTSPSRASFCRGAICRCWQPAVKLDGEIVPEKIAAAIGRHFAAFDVVEGEGEVALAFRWRGEPSFERLSAFARAITLSLANTLRRKKPLYLILDGDIASTLGGILKDDWQIGSELLVIDGVALRDFDYIDLGRIRMPSHTVPVTIKSLVFSKDPRVPHEHRHHHHG